MLKLRLQWRELLSPAASFKSPCASDKLLPALVVRAIDDLIASSESSVAKVPLQSILKKANTLAQSNGISFSSRALLRAGTLGLIPQSYSLLGWTVSVEALCYGAKKRPLYLFEAPCASKESKVLHGQGPCHVGVWFAAVPRSAWTHARSLKASL